MLKRSARYFTLALTLVALTATVRTAHADDLCSNPSVPCVVSGTDPQPSGSVVGGTDPQPSGGDGTDNSQSTDGLISSLIILYGLA